MGRALAERLRPGDMVLLRGALGAGKSVLVRGMLEALGSDDWAGSPTFALVHEYATRPPTYHIDLYRLTGTQGQEIGLEEYVRPDSLVIVEWADRAPEYLNSIAARAPIWAEVAIDVDDRRTISICDRSRGEPESEDVDECP